MSLNGQTKIFIIGLFLFMIVVQSCSLSNSNKDIENTYWFLSDIRRNEKIDRSKIKKHQIDHISFNESRYYYLRSNTIYRDDLPYAVIIKKELDKKKYIEIVAIATTDTLCYVGRK